MHRDLAKIDSVGNVTVECLVNLQEDVHEKDVEIATLRAELQVVRNELAEVRDSFSSAMSLREQAASPHKLDEDISSQKRSEELAECQSKVLEMIAKGVPAAKSMAYLICRIESICSGMLCTLLRLDDDGKHVRHVAAARMPDQYTQAIDGLPIGPNTGSCGTAIYERKQVIVEDIATDPRWEDYRAFALSSGLRSCWSTPILDEEGNAIGSFANYYSHPCSPTDDHIKVIKMSTYLASIALAKQKQDESIMRFRAIVEQAPLGIAEGDFHGRFRSANQRYAEIVGYTLDELKAMSFVNFTHPDDLLLDMTEMQRLAAGEITNFSIEKRYIRKDQAIVWVRLTVAALGKSGIKPMNCLAVLDDITARKETEAALVQSERRYRTIVESEPECVKVVNAQGELLEMNRAGLSMLEADSISQARSHGMIKFILPKYQATFAELHANAIAGNHGLLEFEIIGLKGGRRWLETHAAPLADAHGRISKMLSITRDITEQKQNALALQQKEERLRFLLNNTPAVIYTCRPDGDFGTTFITDNIESQLGYLPSQFLDDAKFWFERIHPTDRMKIQAAFPKLYQSDTHTLEYRFRHSDGSYRWMHDNFRLLRNASGIPTEIIGSWVDITLLKQAEENVRQLNAELEIRVRERTAQLETVNRELESFSYSVSHDLRAPLRGVDGYSRILQEDYAKRLDPEGCRLLEVVRSETKRMGRLIDDLLAFSRMGRKQFENEKMDMRSLAEEALESVRQSAVDSSVQFNVGALPPSAGDPALLRQVFVNLISNAVKFSRTQTMPKVEVGFEPETNGTVYFVRDNGVGFEEQFSHKLFGVFQRLHSEEEFEGTGIGLALVQRIVQRHGGKVWAKSKPNFGATFFFFIPSGAV